MVDKEKEFLEQPVAGGTQGGVPLGGTSAQYPQGNVGNPSGGASGGSYQTPLAVPASSPLKLKLQMDESTYAGEGGTSVAVAAPPATGAQGAQPPIGIPAMEIPAAQALPTLGSVFSQPAAASPAVQLQNGAAFDLNSPLDGFSQQPGAYSAPSQHQAHAGVAVGETQDLTSFDYQPLQRPAGAVQPTTPTVSAPQFTPAAPVQNQTSAASGSQMSLDQAILTFTAKGTQAGAPLSGAAMPGIGIHGQAAGAPFAQQASAPASAPLPIQSSVSPSGVQADVFSANPGADSAKGKRRGKRMKEDDSSWDGFLAQTAATEPVKEKKKGRGKQDKRPNAFTDETAKPANRSMKDIKIPNWLVILILLAAVGVAVTLFLLNNLNSAIGGGTQSAQEPSPEASLVEALPQPTRNYDGASARNPFSDEQLGVIRVGGIVINSQGKATAILESDGVSYIVGEGDTLPNSVWSVQSIDRISVTFSSVSGEKTVFLDGVNDPQTSSSSSSSSSSSESGSSSITASSSDTTKSNTEESK